MNDTVSRHITRLIEQACEEATAVQLKEAQNLSNRSTADLVYELQTRRIPKGSYIKISCGSSTVGFSSYSSNLKTKEEITEALASCK